MNVHQIVPETDAEAAEIAIAADMRSYGLNPSDVLDRFVMARLLELGIVPMPGEDAALH